MEAGHWCECVFLCASARAAAVAAQCQAAGWWRRVAGGAHGQVSTARHSCWCTNTAVLALSARPGLKTSDAADAAVLASVLHAASELAKSFATLTSSRGKVGRLKSTKPVRRLSPSIEAPDFCPRNNRGISPKENCEACQGHPSPPRSTATLAAWNDRYQIAQKCPRPT